MATSTFTSPADSDTTADFRAWGSQVSAQLQACGLVQTADTGQINWSTVTLGSYSTTVSFGYEVYHFSASDPNQATTPIFLKIEYGASAAETPQIWVTIGTGSNGSGTITGTPNPSARLNPSTGSATFGNAYPSYICHNAANGFLGIVFKVGIGSTNSPCMCLYISRTNNTAGAATADGFTAWANNGNSGNTQYYFLNPTYPKVLGAAGAWAASNSWAVFPGGLTQSFANGSLQVVPWSQLQPAYQVSANMCMAILSEVPVGTTVSINPVGLTNNTYISTGTSLSLSGGAAGTYTTMMLWQ